MQVQAGASDRGSGQHVPPQPLLRTLLHSEGPSKPKDRSQPIHLGCCCRCCWFLHMKGRFVEYFGGHTDNLHHGKRYTLIQRNRLKKVRDNKTNELYAKGTCRFSSEVRPPPVEPVDCLSGVRLALWPWMASSAFCSRARRVSASFFHWSAWRLATRTWRNDRDDRSIDRSTGPAANPTQRVNHGGQASKPGGQGGRSAEQCR